MGIEGNREHMRLARLWREHLQAGCPGELAGVEIAGTDARELDAEITACVSALLTHTMRVDGRIERRLAEVSAELARRQSSADPPIAEYCARLNQLVSAVLTESRTERS